jgi:uncharacterized protein (DUF2236 family)
MINAAVAASRAACQARPVSISDLGLYGPDSVTWRVHADPVMGAAGLRALLLQALHPRAMAGVAAHSEFRADPWGRLFRTAEYVGVTTYGTSEDAGRAAARVRGLHRRGRVVDPETGAEYRLSDPELLLWVHCSEVESFLSTARRAGLRLTDAEADRYVAEQVRGARLVGLDPADHEVPASVAGLDEYFTAVRPSLRLTPAAIEAAHFLAVPPMRWRVRLATPALPAWLSLVTLAFSLLPGWARQLYAMPVVPLADLGATVSVRALRTALLAVPASLRDGPHVKDARARVAAQPVRRLVAVPDLTA